MTAALAAAIARALDSPATVSALNPRTGGSICDAFIARMSDGARYFVKTHAATDRLPGLFVAEFAALEALAAVRAIRVPRPIVANARLIIMEALDLAPAPPGWQRAMGAQLAALHLATRRDTPGFDRDNYIGTMPQANATHSDWPAFWRTRRLEPQIRYLAARAGETDPLVVALRHLSARLDEVLAAPREPYVLLHGDLWSGNAAADAHGAPVIFDPASYYGRREVEFGMMEMFGGFDEHCFAAYAECWPLADECRRRITTYRLYHELNHLNLFGGAYYEACRSSLRAIL